MKACAGDAVHGQAHAVHRDRALRRDEARELRRRLDLEAASCRRHRRRPASNRVTVPTPSTCPVIRCPPRRSARRSAISRFTSPTRSSPVVQRSVSADTSNDERRAVDRDDRQAAAVDGDAVADRDVARRRARRCRRRCAARRPSASRGGDASHRLHDSGEHQASSRTTRAMHAQVVADARDVVQRRARRDRRARQGRPRTRPCPAPGSPSRQGAR